MTKSTSSTCLLPFCLLLNMIHLLFKFSIKLGFMLKIKADVHLGQSVNVLPCEGPKEPSQIDVCVKSWSSQVTLEPLTVPNLSEVTAVPLDLQKLYKPQTIFGWFTKEDLLTTTCEAQRRLLEYASDEELQEIVNAQTSYWIPDICDKIKHGKWQKMLDAYGHKDKIGYVLLAAYCRKYMTIEDLATAMTMVRAFHNAPAGAVKIVPVGSDHYPMFQAHIFLDDGKSETLKAEATRRRICEVPQNQRYIILVKFDAFDEQTRDLLTSAFTPTQKTIGVRKYKLPDGKIYLGVASFGLASKFFSVVAGQRGSKRRLTPMLHLVPSRKQMAEHLLAGRSPVALLMPGETADIHRTTGGLTWPYAHDLYHEMARLCRLYWAEYAQTFALIVESKVLADFTRKCVEKMVAAGRLHLKSRPIQGEMPTQEELVRYVLDRLCNQLVDGEFTVIPMVARFQTIKGLVSEIIMHIQNGYKNHYPSMVIDCNQLNNDVISALMPAFEEFHKRKTGFLSAIQEPLFPEKPVKTGST